MSNRLLPFLIESRGVRGFAVSIDGGLSTLGGRLYPPDVAQLLGQALAATPLLAADLRAEARFNLQFQGKGALKLLVTQIDQELRLRGMAKSQDEARGDFHALMRGGLLACLLEPRNGGQNYQAVVEILGETLAEALQLYFERSEQLPTLIRLAAGHDRYAGLMLQRVPEKCGDPDWQHVRVLFGTLGEAELLAADAETLLRRLFAEETVRVFEPRPVTLACQCSHAGISAMLLALGEDEVRPVLAEQGRVEVTCEFCGKVYSFGELEVRTLFEGAKSEAAQQTRH